MKTTLLALIIAAATATVSFAAETAPAKLTRTLNTLLEATQENDLDKFESVCDKTMRQAMNELSLQSVHEQIAKHMENGYTAVYLGSLDHLAYTVHLWKLDFKDNSVPDTLAELSWNDGKVSGFFLR